jgi:hypothetical protein
MADAIDSKSIEGNLMRVQLSPAAPVRNLQAVSIRLAEFIPHRTCSGAGLDDQIVGNFGRKNQLAILFEGEKIFS